MRIVVHGLGVVGLPLAATLARSTQVVGVETSEARRATILDDTAPLREPGLRELVRSTLSAGRFTISAAPVEAPIHVLCLPTPLAGQRADLSCLERLALPLRRGDLVILESTVPPGTLERIATPGTLWAVAPERILPGRALHELSTVDRVVGGLTPEATALAASFYRDHLGVGVHETDHRTATVTKLLENASRDVQIALANELADLAETAGANVEQAFRLARTHPRVDLLEPGIGVGGHCIPVDPWFLVQDQAERARLIPAARDVNERARRRALEKIRAAADAMHDPLIGCLGVSYKAGTGDLRNSPALAIARELHAEGRRVLVADPMAEPVPDLPWASIDQVVRADLAVLLVPHASLVRRLRTRVGVLDLSGALS